MQELRKTVLTVARGMGTGLEFFWNMSLIGFLHLLKDFNEIIEEENRRIRARRKK